MLYSRYRTPIIERTPIVQRTPIMEDKVDPFEKLRSPIGGYCPVSSCSICSENCGGVEFLSPEDYVGSKQIFRLIRIEDSYDSEETCELISSVEQNYRYIRLVTDSPIDEQVIKALAYSHFNVLQFNINIHHRPNWIEFRKSICRAKSYGLYVSIMLYSIIPGAVTIRDTLKFIESTHNFVRHYAFKFFEENVEITPSGKYCVINNGLVPDVFLDHGEGYTKCKSGYIKTFMTRIEKLLLPRKIGFSVCNYSECY